MELEINKFLITETPAQLSAIKQEAETSTGTEEQAGPLLSSGTCPGQTTPDHDTNPSRG